MVWLLQLASLLLVLTCASKASNFNTSNIKLYHIIDNALWGEVDGTYLQGNFSCPEHHLQCEMFSSDSKSDFFNTIAKKYEAHRAQWTNANLPLTVSLYNIHTWRSLSNSWPQDPDRCRLPTMFTMAESEESFGRFGNLFHKSFPLFDGNSTTHPKATVPRSYISCLNQSDFISIKSRSSLIQGAAYVASTCHHGDKTVKREQLVAKLRSFNIRIDGLGKCSHTSHIPEGIKLTFGATPRDSLRLKQHAISNYMFYLAFENTKEPGYVTEKVFDALIAGVVPIYVGATSESKLLLPIPRAIIYVDDFQNDLHKLSDYLVYLIRNQTAYEEHRAWRTNFNPTKMLSPLLQKSWPCRVCEWAHQNARNEETILSALKTKSRNKHKKCPTITSVH